MGKQNKDPRRNYVSRIQLPETKVVSPTENLNRINALSRYRNDSIVREESKPKFSTTTETLDFDKDRNYNNLTAGQKQTVINRYNRDGDATTPENKFRQMQSERGGSLVAELIDKIAGKKASGLSSSITRISGGKFRNYADKGNKDYDKEDMYILYKTALENKDGGYTKAYGETGDKFVKGSSLNMFNPSKTSNIAGFNGRTSNHRNKNNELVITDEYDFGKTNYDKDGKGSWYGKLRDKMGEIYDAPKKGSNPNHTGQTYVTIPKALEQEFKQKYLKEQKGAITDVTDYVFNKSVEKFNRDIDYMKEKGSGVIDFLNDKKAAIKRAKFIQNFKSRLK